MSSGFLHKDDCRPRKIEIHAGLSEADGKARRTIFLCRYLRLRELRREIHEGLNVVENWNSANDFILFGKGGDIATNRREDQE